MGTENLDAALRHIAVDNDFWIDAVCTYSHGNAIIYFGFMRFVPKVFEDFDSCTLVESGSKSLPLHRLLPSTSITDVYNSSSDF
jgi:hypothetical protein